MTPAEFKIWFPEFSSELDARVQLFLGRAVPFFDESRWGSWLDEGVANYVASMLWQANKQAKNAGAAGMSPASKTVDRLSVSYSGVGIDKAQENPHYGNSYGQRYLYLARLVGMGAVAV